MSRHVEREILSALIDGELTPDQRRMVHEHLQTCADCREASEEFAHIHGMVGELPRLVAPLQFMSDALEPPPRSAPVQVARAAMSGRRKWVLLGLASAAIAISLAGLVTPPQATEVPVDAFIARHVSTHASVEPGAQVLFAVNRR